MKAPAPPAIPSLVRPALPPQGGFTLIELLTVIAIIGILAGIMIPTVGKVRRMANDAQCKTALRQWGVAMQLYIDDNKGRLPGPCLVVLDRSMDVLPEVIDNNGRQLFRFLAPYMNLKNHNDTLVPEAYVCSGWTRETPNPDGSIYLTRMPDHRTIALPYGYGKPPMLYTDVLAMRYIKEMVALVDLDDAFVADDYSKRAPSGPVHGDHRNALFWDWHVGIKKADDMGALPQ
ncbi:prepilin-type N-terminal cleavage/methylation domain-containing protein [Opitutaceae bacterium TAV1]|nr:prepilin-type N-terminal cleavage/methylation domain-containing protein [Opitutaceae bacterium TAV1]